MAKKDEKNVKDKTSFSKRFKAELKKVVWPTPKQLFNNTVAVLVIVIVTSLIVFLLDLAFESMNKYGINKLKTQISNSSSEETNNAENSENSEAESTQSTDTDNATENSESSEENTSETNAETTETTTTENAAN